jgi:hypothetical protein
MATEVEDCTSEEQGSLLRFLCTKGLMVKDIHKEMIPIYDGKRLSRNVVPPRRQTFH